MTEAAAVKSPQNDPNGPWSSLGAWRLNGHAERTISFNMGDGLTNVSVRCGIDDYKLTLEGASYTASGKLGPNGRLDATLEGHRLVAWALPDGDYLQIFLDNETARLEVVDPLRTTSSLPGSLGGLEAPMPGTIISLLVEAGAEVTQGAPLLILEAMKMEHTVRAPSAGRVNRFRYAVGDQVPDGAELVDFDPDSKL
jgi:3-methylcrotonyl-CoA carboxylase alpha subunit